MQSLLEVRGLVKHYPPFGANWLHLPSAGAVRAVDGVDFEIAQSETLALIGESGCGKSTIARCLLGLEKASAGSIRFDGCEMTALSRRSWRLARKNIGLIFQNPFGSLNPRLTAHQLAREPLVIHGVGSKLEQKLRASDLLERVGIGSRDADRLASELSGGQQQRVAIARALALSPKLVVCDEPVSALDVSIRAQILNLLTDLQRELQLTYLVISHDIQVVQHVANRVCVMYMGKIVETGAARTVLASPSHPYTAALISSVPSIAAWRRPVGQRLVGAPQGEVGDPTNPPAGCRFHPRCPKYQEGICDVREPLLDDISPNTAVACFFPMSGPSKPATQSGT